MPGLFREKGAVYSVCLSRLNILFRQGEPIFERLKDAAYEIVR